MFSEKRNWQLKWASLGMLLGMSQFLILTILAMIFYAGGNQYYPTTSSYDFFQNFFSDLGMQVAWNGNSNLLASVLFTIALAVSGISIFPFIMYFSSLFSRGTAPYRFSILTLISGIPTSIGFILIGFTPWDLYFSYHMISVYVAFGGAVPLSIGFTGAIWTAKKFPRYLVGVGIYASLIILLFLIGLVIWGPSGSETARIIRVVGQKIVVFAIIIGLFIEGWGMWNFLHVQRKNN